MSLEPASVLVAGGTDERQLLVDYDTMEVIGAAPDDPNTLIISVAAAMPGGPSEVVLATVDANDRLLMDSPVLNRLAELATQVADVRATQEALGVTDEVIAAAAAAEEQSMAEIQAIAEEEEQRVEERADQTPEPGQPEQPAASTEPAPVAATESTAAAAAAPAPAATPEPAPAAQAEQQPAAAESTPAAAAESTPAATIESTPAAAAAPESAPAAAAAEPATAAAPHDLAPEPGAAEAAALAEAQPAAAHAGRPGLGAEASAAAATGSAQATSGAAAVGRDYAAIESAIFAQSPIDIYSIEDGTTATRYETVSWTPVSARAEIADRDGWRLLAGLTVNGVACGEHDLTILAANGTYYLYVTNSALDTINAAVAGGSSEGQSTGDEYDYDAVETYLFGQAPVYVYNSADPSDTPRSYNRVQAAPVYRAMLPDSSGWILTTALSIGGTDCGTHDITVVLSGENYYLYAPQDALDAIDTALRQAGGADEAEPDDAQDAYGLHGAEEAEQLPHEVGTATTDAR